MFLPILQEEKSTRQVLETFKGYNRNLRIGDGEFADMKNMSSDFYPVLSPRGKRGLHDTASVVENSLLDPPPALAVSPTAMISKDALCYVSGSHFVVGGVAWDLGLTEGEKQLVSMGAHVAVFPDGKYINAAELTKDTVASDVSRETGTLGASYTSTEGDKVTFDPCNINGEVYENITSGNAAPAEPENMTLWMDTSGEKKVLKQYTAVTSTWVTIPTTYVKISAIGIGDAFSRYDGVRISAQTAQFSQWLESAGIAGEGNVILWGVNNEDVETEDFRDSIIVVGLLSESFETTEPITVERSVPKMDFVIECGNRLWGCAYYSDYDRYGVRQVLNEIYASKLGDFKNWNCFMGLSTDSYAAVVGTDGPFTGAAAYNGSPIFFKENSMHRVYGTQPSNFQIQTSDCKGVQPGSAKSLVAVNEVLYYKSSGGVMSYDGSYPIEVSYAFGSQRFGKAVAGAIGNKYYICMTDSDSGERSVFVYDTQKGLWHREDSVNITDFCDHRGELYAIDSDRQKILTMLGSGLEDEKSVEWMVESGMLYLSFPDAKYLSRIVVRMQMEIGAKANFFVKYDTEQEWTLLCSLRSQNMRSFSVPIKTARCDTMRLRIEGEGNVKVFSVTKTFDQGSDVW